MKVLILYSINGGVRKAIGAVNLAFCVARSGYRTQVWDLDPQAAGSYYFRIQATFKGGTKHELPANVLIKETDFDPFDLLPSDFS